MSSERRVNWKAKVGKKAVERAQLRQTLMADLEIVRKNISQTGTDYEQYDKLKEEQRAIIAQLATLSE